MNIFYLHNDPKLAARMHCDKHNVKMIVETAQLLSTAHRINDGVQRTELSESGRRVKRWVIDNHKDALLYKATHPNHPSAIWARQSKQNYKWLYNLFVNLLDEYTFRYGRQHLSEKLKDVLSETPKNISDKGFFDPPPAMPDYCKVKGDSVQSYRNYYINEKKRFAKWTKRETPYWFK